MDASRPIENLDIEEATYSKPRRGAPINSVWSYAFDDPNVCSIAEPNNAVCKHCKESVRHHHKTMSDKTHLRRCKQFKKMLDTAVSDRPDWWTDRMSTAKKSTESTSSKGKSTCSSTRSKSPQSAKLFAIPLFNASEQKKFNHEMAMHFYCTGTSFQRV